MLKVYEGETFDEDLELSNECDDASCHQDDSGGGDDDGVMMSRFDHQRGDGDGYEIS